MKSLSISVATLLLLTSTNALQIPFFAREQSVQSQVGSVLDQYVQHHHRYHEHYEKKVKESWFTVPRWIKNAFPHHPPHPGPPPVIDLSDYTIAEILNNTLHSPAPNPRDGPPRWPPLKKFAFFVNLTDSEEFKKSLADPEASVTLFAPDDIALSREGHRAPPHHDHGHHHHDGPPHHGPPGHHHGPASVKSHPFTDRKALSALVERETSENGDDEEHKKRKEIFLHIVSVILRYHLIDSGAYSGRDLINNATIASSLHDARIRVEPTLFPHPSLILNFFSRTRGPTLKAKNGFIHLVSSPLLPPLTPLEELFVFPFIFSELTSGLQKVDLDEALSPWIHHGKADEVAEPVTSILEELMKEKFEIRKFTVFAPSNRAFFKLGPKINAFLFSPFGRHVLKAILEYHVVPDVVLFTDFVSDSTKASYTEESVDSMPHQQDEHLAHEMVEAGLMQPKHSACKLPAPGEIKVRHYNLKTLWNDTSLPVDVYESRRGPFGKGPVRRSIWVGDGSGHTPGDRVQVSVADAVAYNAAVHVVGTLIRPPFNYPEHHHHEHHEHFEKKSNDHPHTHHAERSFWHFARSLSGEKHAGSCHGRKRSDVWDKLLPQA